MDEAAPAEDFSSRVLPADNTEDLTLRRQLFYRDFADTIVRLSDGKILRFSKDQLFKFTKSTVLRQLFYGDLRDEVTDILDANFDRFKLFLDCLLGLEPYTEENSRGIFPVAWKYQVDESLDKIYKGLTPTELNVNIVHTLNLATFYNCEYLYNDLLYPFLSRRQRYRNLLEKEEYYNLLSVKSYKYLIEMITDYYGLIDSYFIDCMFKWAENYLKTNHPDQPINIKEFLEEQELDEYVKFSAFETTGSIIRFCQSPLGKGYFSEDDIPDLLQRDQLKHGEGKWFLVNAGETITEKFWARVPFYQNSESLIRIIKNDAVFYDGPEYNNEHDESRVVVTCKVKIRGDDRKFGFSITDLEWEWNFYNDIVIPSKVNELKELNFKVKWTFKYPCRILKTSHSTDGFEETEFQEKEELELFFTSEAPEWYDSRMNVIQENESEEEEEVDDDESDLHLIRRHLRLQTAMMTTIMASLPARR